MKAEAKATDQKNTNKKKEQEKNTGPWPAHDFHDTARTPLHDLWVYKRWHALGVRLVLNLQTYQLR